MRKELIQDYLKTNEAIINFKQKHKEVFDSLDILKETKNEQEQTIKQRTLETKNDFENDKIKINFVQPYRKNYDIKKLQSDEKVILKFEGIIKEEINGKLFEEKVKDETIERHIMAKCFSETPQTARVLIRIKNLK